MTSGLHGHFLEWWEAYFNGSFPSSVVALVPPRTSAVVGAFFPSALSLVTSSKGYGCGVSIAAPASKADVGKGFWARILAMRSCFESSCGRARMSVEKKAIARKQRAVRRRLGSMTRIIIGEDFRFGFG